MALFGRKEEEASKPAPPPQNVRQTAPRQAYCRICKKDQSFSKCWMRLRYVMQCMCCKTQFTDPRPLYAKNLPACPRCGEFLEQPNFEYGLCDGCGSKYEFVQGAVPSMLPNKSQRDAMEKHGKSWSRD